MGLSKLIIMSIAIISFNAFASTKNEINHLLNFVASTECQYERNGTMHDGKEAVAHIKKKYAYYSDDIGSTEDFIKFSATKSKMSGKYYKIHCLGKKPVKSQDWLNIELQAYRAVKHN